MKFLCLVHGGDCEPRNSYKNHSIKVSVTSHYLPQKFVKLPEVQNGQNFENSISLVHKINWNGAIWTTLNWYFNARNNHEL